MEEINVSLNRKEIEWIKDTLQWDLDNSLTPWNSFWITKEAVKVIVEKLTRTLELYWKLTG